MKPGPFSLGAILVVLAAAAAGAENQAFVRQVSPEGSLHGNTLVLDQSGAQGSSLTGVTLDTGNPLLSAVANGALAVLGNDADFATQTGEGNAARLVLGDNSQVQLFQSSAFVAGAQGNSAEVNAAANARGTVVQVGDLNQANLDLGIGASGLVTQLGSRLSTDLSVESGASATVAQVGNGSIASLTVASGTSVELTQRGDNLVSSIPGGVQVISNVNTGNIVITQSSW